ncbi:MAG: adenylate/guanylate cyclase domain-containing protein [Candidatus Anammoxibacter sp.]
MDTNENNPDKKEDAEEVLDVDKLMEERARLDKIFEDKISRVVTVMFTDLKGSTAIAEAQGDLASLALIKQHNDIVLPPIKDKGVLVKTMGDGTLSYFESAQKAVKVAMQIQSDVDKYNVEKNPKTPILVRIGLHTGKTVIEKNDIFGDVVNTASRFESSAHAGEIYLSEETFNAFTDKTEIYCRFIKTTTLKGKKGATKVYKAFWNKNEIELDKFGPKETEEKKVVKKGFPLFAKVAIGIVVPVIVVLALMFGGTIPNPFVSSFKDKDAVRSLEHTIDIPVDED